MPQQGIMQAARAMAPKSSIAQNTGMDMAMPMQPTQAPQQPQMMADGGIMRLNQGDKLNSIQKQFNPAILELSLKGQYGSGVQREVVGNALAGAYGPEMQSNVLSQARAGAYGSFIQESVQEAMPQNATSDPSSGFFPNDADLATVGGEGIGSVSADVEDFTATDDGISAQTDVANILDVMSQANQGIVREDSPDFINNDLRFSRGTASSIAPSAGSEAINAMRAGADLAQLSGGIGRVSADLSNVEGAPQGIDFDAAGAGSPIEAGTGIRGSDTKASKELAEFLASRRSDVPGANLPGESYPYEIDPDAAEKQGQAILDSLTAPPTGQQNNPNIDGPLSSALQYYGGTAFKGAATPEPTDEERRIIESMSAVPEAGAKIQDSEQGASTLSGDNFSNDPTRGYSFPTDVLPLNPRMEGRQVAGRVIDALTQGEGGVLPEGIYGGYEDPEAIAMREQRLREPTGLPDERRDNDPDLSEFLTPVDESSQLIETGFTGSEDAPFLTPTVTTDGGDVTTGDTGTGTARGSADFGSIESRIARMLDDREKSAEADKWLALAQTGMALMASKNPTLGGALGEAGLAGLSSMQKARSQYDKDILGLLGVQQQVESAKDLAAYRQGTLDSKTKTTGLTSSNLVDILQTLTKEQTDIAKAFEKGEDALGNKIDQTELQQLYLRNQVELADIRNRLGLGGGTKDLAD